jgi:hypothetical protein
LKYQGGGVDGTTTDTTRVNGVAIKLTVSRQVGWHCSSDERSTMNAVQLTHSSSTTAAHASFSECPAVTSS